MKKLISTGSRKSIERARRRLDGVEINASLPGVLQGPVTGSEAIALGVQLLDRARASHALQIAELLLYKVDDVVDVYLIKARALLELESLGELKPLVEYLLHEAGNNIGVLSVASRFYYLIGNIERALMCLKVANDLEPNSIATLLQLELCYRYTNKLEKAEKVLARCFKITAGKTQSNDSVFRQFTSTLLRLAQYTELDDQRFQSLHEVYQFAVEHVDQELMVRTAYALARQFDKRKLRDDEIKYLAIANESESKLLGMAGQLLSIRERYAKELDTQKDVFDRALPPWLPELNADHQPVFILGLPRSGTTLVEQILGTHSQLGQTGESKAFALGLRRAILGEQPFWLDTEYPAGVEKLSPESYQSIIDFFQAHQAVLADQTMYVDKELSNPRYVGLMAALFPGAKFIHVDRAPLDIFLSCYRNSIPGVPESSNLETIAEYYVYVKRLIGHWRSILGDRIAIVNYQELVSDPEPVVAGLCDFLGLGFEQEMLAFYRRDNVVRSLSVDQVRNKIYASSVEKWREYEQLMDPAIQVLRSYEIDPAEGVPFLQVDNGG